MNFEEIYKTFDLARSNVRVLDSQITALLSAMPDPIFVFDSHGNYVNVLGGSARHLYEDGSYLVGKNLKDVFKSETASRFQNAISDCISKNEVSIFEYALHSDDFLADIDTPASYYEGRVSKISVDNDHEVGVVWVAVNISKRKKLEHDLAELANTDPLTKIHNRRAFDARFKERFALFKRYQQDFSFLMIDIDHFKMINDQYGHDIGDEVLKEFCKKVSSELRENDFFARLGGEEFGLILPNTPSGGAERIAERLRANIENSPFEYSESKVNYTVSIGVSSPHENDDSLEPMKKRADEAVYDAKRSGRNRVVSSVKGASRGSN